MTALTAGDTSSGVSQLDAIIKHVSTQEGKKNDATLPDALIAYAQRKS